MQKNNGTASSLISSLKLPFVLAALVATATAAGLMLDASKGPEWTRWYIFRTNWYIGLVALLAISIVVTTLARRPWRWQRPELAILPVGLIVLLAGLAQSLIQGTEGLVVLEKDATTFTFQSRDRSQITLFTRKGSKADTTELGFSPGPGDWRKNEPLSFGNVNGVDIKVLRFLRYARPKTEWIADKDGLSDPAILVSMCDAQGKAQDDRWFNPVLFGTPIVAGEPHITINTTSAKTQLEDFLHPLEVKAGSLGLLTVHYKGERYTLPVDENKGKKVPVASSGLSVEIVEYYANSVSRKGEYTSNGIEPKNPMLLLKVFSPGSDKPVTEIAYSNSPFVTLEAINRKECPAAFWYHHPSGRVEFGAGFLQTPDGSLYCRVGDGKTYKPLGEVKQGDRIKITDPCQITLRKYLPSAEKTQAFESFRPTAKERDAAEAAALLEMKSAEKTERFWLRRNDAQLGFHAFKTSNGPMIVTLGYENRPLGFFMKLTGIREDEETATPHQSQAASLVSVADSADELNSANAEKSVQEIKVGKPLRYGNSTLHQIAVRDMVTVKLSFLRLTTDPGRFLKYLGGFMTGTGMLLALIGLVVRRRSTRAADAEVKSEEEADRESDLDLTTKAPSESDAK
jgi:hypothetical protein